MDTYKKHRNILIEPYRAIYYFLPKVASTTFKSYFVEALGMEKKAHYEKGFGLHNGLDYPFPFALQEALEAKYADYFKFSTVRNPWARLVSCYVNKFDPQNKKIKQGLVLGPFKRFGKAFWPDMTFSDFVDAVCHIPDWEADRHFRSQYYQLSERGGRIDLTFIAKIENLASDLEIIQGHTGLPKIELPRYKQSSKKHYTTYYDKALQLKIAERYATDIDLFGYTFGEQKTPSIHFLKDKPVWEVSLPQSKNHLISSAKSKELLKGSQLSNKLWNAKISMKKELESLNNQSLLITQNLKELEVEIIDLEEKNKQHLLLHENLQSELKNKEDELNLISHNIDDLKSTWFWKLSSPLRWILKKTNNS